MPLSTPSRPDPSVPVAPVWSMYDPVYLGIDEFGAPVYETLVYRNLLTGGEPGAGKSGLLNTIAAHAALSHDARLCLFDGKTVELGMWEHVADVFVGPDLDHAIATLRRLQQVMDNRYAYLRARRRRKVVPADHLAVLVVIVDEIAYFSATVGAKTDQELFAALLRDLVARGRACGLIVIAATQRPSIDIIPTSLRDIFGYRMAFRCTTYVSSDIVLGHGWATQGYSAHTIAPDDSSRGVGWLIAEGGIPRKMRVAYLTDDHITYLADYAAHVRHHPGPLPHGNGDGVVVPAA